MLTHSGSALEALFAKLDNLGDAVEPPPDSETARTVLALYYQALTETDAATKNAIFARLACLPVNKMAEIIIRCRDMLENKYIPAPSPGSPSLVVSSSAPAFGQPSQVVPIEVTELAEELGQAKPAPVEKVEEAKPLDDGLMATGLV